MRSFHRAAIITALLTIGACEEEQTHAQASEPIGAHSDAGTASPPPSFGLDGSVGQTEKPIGYRPPALVPEGYNPPSLLTLTPEQQLEMFRRVEQSYVTTTAKRGPTASPLPISATPIAPSVSWGDRRYDDLTSFMNDARITGILAVKSGEIVLERYAHGRTTSDRWTSFSVGKSITSLLIGAAIQDGYIGSIDEAVTKYIPELAGSGYDGVNIRQLITMTSGIRWNEDYADPNSDVSLSAFWPGEPGVNPLVSYMRKLPRVAEPGTVFSYKTGETDMAGILVANATGRGLAQYLSEKIWAPFGMEQDALWIVDGGSVERGGCCISMTLRDYARVGLFVLSGGIAGGKQVVPPGYLAEATSNQLEPPATGSYGYFWWVDPDGSYAARGIFGQMIQIVPQQALVIVVNSAFPTAVSQEHRRALTGLIAAIRAATR